VVALSLLFTTFGKRVSVTDVIYVNCYKGEEASICYAFGVSTTLQTIMKFILTFFSFFIRDQVRVEQVVTGCKTDFSSPGLVFL
jgi:hypothetical protein